MAENEASAPRPSVTQILSRDHRRLDAVLAAAKQALFAGDVPGGRARFSEFRSGLERHIQAEEEVAFPAFEAVSGGADGGPTAVMRHEHVELRSLMGDVAAELEPEGKQAYTTPLAALTARLFAHNGKEERILYPMMDRAALDSGTIEELIRRIPG